MNTQDTLLQLFTTLSWDDIVIWAGYKIADRGRRYQRDRRVKDLAATTSGSLVASVLGSELYKVQVSIDSDGHLESRCTCPYAFDCKHGVATVLEFLSRIKYGRQIPMRDEQDVPDPALAISEEDVDTGPKSAGSASKPSQKKQLQIENVLRSKSKEQLIAMIQGFAKEYPEIESLLLHEAQLHDGNIAELTRRLKQEIIKISSEPAWSHHWDDEAHLPDYSGIRKKLSTLLASGYADEVLALGKELFECGNSQIEMSDDDGETAIEIGTCLDLLPQALQASSLSESERLLWALDLELADSFEICGAIDTYLREEHSASSWDTVADILLKRLAEASCHADDRYQRDELSNWIIHALEEAGREAEILPLCEAEAPISKSYERLVRRLMDLKRYDDAEHWIHEGIVATEQAYSGIASRLHDLLLEIRVLQEDWHSVAIFQTEEFIRHPSASLFEQCQSAATHLGLWPKIREALLAYLASGILPWMQPEWPLSKTEMHALAEGKTFPMLYELITIAIHEKNAEDLVRWYEQYRHKEEFGYGSLDEDVAIALAWHDPMRAVFIWKKLAEQQIALVKPNAYYEACSYLRRAAKLMLREKKAKEWQHYLASIKRIHYRKKRLLEILDTLSTKPILEE